MGVLVQQREAPLCLRGYPPCRIRERLANGPGSYYNRTGSQSIVASNQPGVAQSSSSCAPIVVLPLSQKVVGASPGRGHLAVGQPGRSRPRTNPLLACGSPRPP